MRCSKAALSNEVGRFGLAITAQGACELDALITLYMRFAPRLPGILRIKTDLVRGEEFSPTIYCC